MDNYERFMNYIVENSKNKELVAETKKLLPYAEEIKQLRDEYIQYSLRNSNGIEHIQENNGSDNTGNYIINQDRSFANNTGNDGKSKRDTTKYEFQGRRYNKRDLVYACFCYYKDKNPDISIEEMKKIFPKELQGSFGVFTTQKDMEFENRDELYKKRFFENTVKVGDETCYVCSEWNVNNIGRFCDAMRSNGLVIEEIK